MHLQDVVLIHSQAVSDVTILCRHQVQVSVYVHVSALV